MDQDVGLFEDALHAVGVGDEVRREVAAVELHAFDQVQFGAHGLGLFDGDDAVLADLLHGLGDGLADFGVTIGGDGADLGDLLVVLDLDRHLADFFDHDGDGLLDTALQGHRIGAGGDGLDAFAEDGLGQDGGRSGAVTSDVGGLGGNLAHHLRAHVFKRVLQFDFLGDGDAVLGNRGTAEFLLEYYVAAFRTEGHLHGVGKLVDAAQDRLARILAINNLLRCHYSKLLGKTGLRKTTFWPQPVRARRALRLHEGSGTLRRRS